MTTTLSTQFKAARRVSTPIIAINTPDPAATIEVVSGLVNGAAPILRWDVIQGVLPMNELGQDVWAKAAQDVEALTFRGPDGLIEALDLSLCLPGNCVLYVSNAHRYMDDPGVVQAVWNVRDDFKAVKNTLVLLSPGISLPAELQPDVLILDEALPDADQLAAIVRQLHEVAELDEPVQRIVDASTDALMGLGAFPAEQAAAMSLTPDGMDVDALWSRKRQMIEATPGLSVWQGGETFADIGGVSNIKGFLEQVLVGNAKPRAVVFIDEIEKSLAGSSGAAADSSGVSQDFLGQLLTFMQDTEASGMIFVGPPGSAKSMVAKAAGNTGGIPTIQLDLGGMKGSLVGQSEQALRQALKVVTAVSGGETLFIATCNSLAALPPELRRRFGFGTYYFDLPDEAERAAIWDLYFAKYPTVGLNGDKPADDTGWTGAEIRQCADLAWRLDCPLSDVAQYIVPVAKSAAETIENLRAQASGRFISASHPGVYRPAIKQATVRLGRSIEVGDAA